MQIEISQGGQPQTDPRPGVSSVFSPESLKDPHQDIQEQELSKAIELLRKAFGGSLDREALNELLHNLHLAQNVFNSSNPRDTSPGLGISDKIDQKKKTSGTRSTVTAAEIADMVKAVMSAEAQGLSFEQELKLKDLVDYIAQGIEMSTNGASFQDRNFWTREETPDLYETDSLQDLMLKSA